MTTAASDKLQATVNGTTMVVPEGLTIEGLLNFLEIQPGLIAVEQNLEIVPKRDYSIRLVRPGDKIEIVHFVGGG